MLAAAYLAANTRRIRIGLAARVLPFQLPPPLLLQSIGVTEVAVAALEATLLQEAAEEAERNNRSIRDVLINDRVVTEVRRVQGW